MAASPNSGRKCGAAHGRIRGFADVGNVGLVAGLQSGAQVPASFRRGGRALRRAQRIQESAVRNCTRLKLECRVRPIGALSDNVHIRKRSNLARIDDH